MEVSKWIEKANNYLKNQDVAYPDIDEVDIIKAYIAGATEAEKASSTVHSITMEDKEKELRLKYFHLAYNMQYSHENLFNFWMNIIRTLWKGKH